MAKTNNPLVKCPGFRRCGTMVQQSKVGDPHRYQVWNPQLEKFEWFDCNGS